MAATDMSKPFSGTNLNERGTTDRVEAPLTQTLMMAATTNPVLAAVMTGDVESLENLLLYKNDINQDILHGFTPLMIATLCGQLEAALLLRSEGTDVKKMCEDTTALMVAANICISELEHVYGQGILFPGTSELTGDSVSVSNADCDKTSLLEKVMENKTKVMTWLLQAGADPNIRERRGRNALILATENSPSGCLGSMFEMWMSDTAQSVINTELLKRCLYLIDYHVDINTRDNDGMTALMYAVRNRLDNVCKLLIEHKADVNIVDIEGNTALMYSLMTGSKHLSRLLLQNGAILGIQGSRQLDVLHYGLTEKPEALCTILPGDGTRIDIHGMINGVTRETKGIQFSVRTGGHDVETLAGLWDILSMACCRRNNENQTVSIVSYDIDSLVSPDSVLGKTLLLIAVANNSLELCKFSLDHGVDPNIKNNDDKAFLIDTILMRSLDMCDMFLRHGALPDVRDVAGKTALMYAVIHRLSDFADVLISYGADVNLQDATGMTALMYAIHCKMDDCCQLLLRRGADVSIQNESGHKALMFAASAKFEFGIKRLIESKANLNLQDVKGRTALMYAALKNSARDCKLLVDSNADLNIKDQDGMTAVLHCAQKLFLTPLSILLLGGANPNLTDKQGSSALVYTIQKCVEFSRMSQNTEMCNALDCCKVLVYYRANVNFQDSSGTTLVIWCAQRKDGRRCLDILLSGSPDLDLKDCRHFTALMHASRNNLPDICEVLVRNGADSNIQDMMGMSAMMHAVLENSYECTERFLSLGMDPNEQMGRVYVSDETDGGDENVMLQNLGRAKSAFQLAVILDFDEMCQLMMSHGVDVNKQDRDGRTALMYAALHNSSHCFQLLIEYADLTVEDNEGRTVMSYAIRPEYIQKLQAMGLEDRAAVEEEKGSVFSLLMKDVNLFMHLQRDGFVINMLFQVLIILENGTSPFLEPNERSLLHKANSLQLPVHENNDCLKHLRLETCINSNNHRLLRLLVCNGVVPACGSQSSTVYPVMPNVLENGDEDVVKYLIANCYLTDQDVAYMRDWGPYRNMANRPLPEQIFQHPWPLVKLAFISVSTALGGGPGREARVSKTGLPVKLQDMLLFRQPAAQIPVREWEDIELCFDPVKYEELPRPRPLLYHWPLGRKL